MLPLHDREAVKMQKSVARVNDRDGLETICNKSSVISQNNVGKFDILLQKYDLK